MKLHSPVYVKTPRQITYTHARARAHTHTHALFLSLSLSHKRTHAHAHTHTHTHSHTHIRTHTCTFSQSHRHSHNTQKYHKGCLSKKNVRKKLETTRANPPIRRTKKRSKTWKEAKGYGAHRNKSERKHANTQRWPWTKYSHADSSRCKRKNEDQPRLNTLLTHSQLELYSLILYSDVTCARTSTGVRVRAEKRGLKTRWVKIGLSRQEK